MPESGKIAGQASKVAAVSLSFWIVKTVVTTVGDLSGDVLSITLNLGYVIALIVALALMVGLVIAQIRVKRCYPLLFWLLILLSSTVGAEFSDAIDRALHWGNATGAGVLFVGLVVTLTLWRLFRGGIVTDSINNRGDEAFYWIAVIFANSLGSVLGDLVGDGLGLGVEGGIVVNLSVLALLSVLYYKTKTNGGLLYWTAFVFTRISF